MKEDGARFDSGFDGIGPFRDTPEAGGISLESALRDFGPAAIDDLIPRVRALAAALDAAHESGAVHGALHPSNVIITGDATSLVTGDRSTPPYLAPEVADGAAPSPASDQFALAAITYEWLLGRPIDRPADRPIQVRTMPGVDRATLSTAFTRALSPKPSDRFASCAAFCGALGAAVVPELPLLAVEPEASELSLREPATRDRDDEALWIPDPGSSIPAALPVADTSMRPRPEPQRFGAFALILATMVGAVFGFAAGYMAIPRALQYSPPAQMPVAPGTDTPLTGAQGATGAQAAPSAPVETERAPSAPAAKASASARAPSGELRRDLAGASGREGGPKAPQAPRFGTLAVDSRPAGASVTINGKPSGTTPLTITDLPPGEYRVVMTLAGYRNFATTVRVVAGERTRAAYSLTALEQE